MRERLIKFLELEQISAARFADDIGVQRSSVSHILSGRNNPGFEFIQKILIKYKKLNAEWLIMGTGNIYKTVVQGKLFSDIETSSVQNQKPEVSSIFNEQKNDPEPLKNDSELVEPLVNSALISIKSNKKIENIILLYSDKTFGTYFPE
jgi:transcriptional regulator with XRE-family HTH domain